MMKKIPFADPSPDLKDQPNESKAPELVTAQPKSAFHWPPDCLWPFMNSERDREA